MADVIYLGIVVVFFLIAYLLVLACDRIIGGSELYVVDGEANSENPKKAA